MMLSFITPEGGKQAVGLAKNLQGTTHHPDYLQSKSLPVCWFALDSFLCLNSLPPSLIVQAVAFLSCARAHFLSVLFQALFTLLLCT